MSHLRYCIIRWQNGFANFVICWILIGSVVRAEEPCGGFIEGNVGSIEIERRIRSEQCIWIVKLANTVDFDFTLTSISPEDSITVYNEPNVGQPPILPLEWTYSDANFTHQLCGQVTVLIYNGMGHFSLSWKGRDVMPIDEINSASYADAEDGNIVWKDFSSQERFAWVLNTPSMSTTVEASVQLQRCQLHDPCICSSFSLYEVFGQGRLREVFRVCGRSSSFLSSDITSPLIGFAVINQTQSTGSLGEGFRVKWKVNQQDPNSGGRSLSDDYFPNHSVLSDNVNEKNGATPDLPDVLLKDSCGGVVIGDSGVIEYKKMSTKENRQTFCVWTIRSSHSQMEIRVDQKNLSPWDRFKVLSADPTGTLSHYNKTTNDFNFKKPHIVDGPVVFIVFETMQSSKESENTNPESGFTLRFKGVGTRDKSTHLYKHFNLNQGSTSLMEVKYPNPHDKNYGPNEFISWTINPSNGSMSTQLRVFHVDFADSMCNDILRVHDIQGNILKKFCYMNTYTTESFRSTGSPFILIMKSDDKDEKSGITFYYQAGESDSSHH